MKYLFIWSLTPKLYELSLNLSIGIALINYLGPVEQGKIGFLINLCTLMSFLTTLGIGPVYSNFVSRSNNERLISNKFKENVTLRFLGYILFLLVSLLFLFFFKKELIYLSIPFLIGKLFFSFDIYYNLIEGKAGFKNYAISKFISLTCINVFRLYCV
ncbi:TPA: O174 family O-antigen flippase, partial [Escherichia coli O174:H8]|nr:O174 family O-antigen flippase [Escherichia coli O174:H8]